MNIHDAPEIDESSLPKHKTTCCETCGQKVRKLNKHTLDKAKVDILVQIAQLNAGGARWVKVQRDGRLIKDDEPSIQCDAIHASRLYWFGLLDRRNHRDGLYRINDYGLTFIKGLATAPAAIFCREGNVVYRSKKRVKVSDVKDVVLNKEFWDSYASHSQRAA
jgi:hypothetical protein